MKTETNMKKLLIKSLFILLLMSPLSLFALTYPLPGPNADVVGHVQHIFPPKGQRITNIARKYQMGFYELIESNPDINRHSAIPSDYRVTIPSEFVLPNVPREGIIINLAELRLYYFPKDKHVVITHPIAIGRFDWMTPVMKSKIIEKEKNPRWFVPKSIQEASAQKGIILPDVVAAGPKNPLGKFAMRLADRSYLIHGTNAPHSIGKRASSGCMRMYPEAIASLFQQVPVGTPVHIINEFAKLGWRNGTLYLEVHEPLQELAEPERTQVQTVATMIRQMTQGRSIRVNWQQVHAALERPSGVPVPISGRVSYQTRDYEDYYRQHDNVRGDIERVDPQHRY